MPAPSADSVSPCLAVLEAPAPVQFSADLAARGYTVITRPTLAALRQALAETETTPAVFILNAASLTADSALILQQARQWWPNTPSILTLAQKTPPAALPATVTLVLPFTPRKLRNAIKRLLPANGDASVQLGPIRLYASLRRVQVHGQERRLTPKQARLLELFLRAPGQVISRRTILKKVWETDYLGDTRTLDVHISWLRHLIEPDPRRPRYLRTVRSLGYRLDIPADPPAGDHVDSPARASQPA